MNWRIIAITTILVLGVVDLALTFYYVRTYKEWQPNKPYNLMEKNPLLNFLWNKIGLVLGTLVGATIMLTIQYLIAKEAHWIVVVILFAMLIFVMYNHYNNTTLLHQLIEKYPSGHLPEETFGKVIGNN